jgi:cytochrome bd-type quinol oxidase subunit 2
MKLFKKDDHWLEKTRKLIVLICMSLSVGIFFGAFIGGAIGRFVLKLDEHTTLVYCALPVMIVLTLLGLKIFQETASIEITSEVRRKSNKVAWIIICLSIVAGIYYAHTQSEKKKNDINSNKNSMMYQDKTAKSQKIIEEFPVENSKR